MRIAIISDIHGNRPGLEAVLADIQRRGADQVFCLGDISYKGPEPAACLDRLRELGIPCIYGNTERWLIAAPDDVLASPRHREVIPWCREQLGPERLAWLEELPFRLEVNLAGTRVALVHGSPRSENEAVYPWLKDEELAPVVGGAGAPVLCVGHHHLPLLRRTGSLTLVGPGSAGFPFDGDPRAAYALLESAGAGDLSVQVVRVPYDVADLEQAVDRARLPDGEWFKATARSGRPGGQG